MHRHSNYDYTFNSHLVVIILFDVVRNSRSLMSKQKRVITLVIIILARRLLKLTLKLRCFVLDMVFFMLN